MRIRLNSLNILIAFFLGIDMKQLWNQLGRFVTDDLAIDLGTQNTLIYSRTLKKIILNEPSVVAIKQEGAQKKVCAVGKDAKFMLGKTPGNIQAIRPMKDGVIADFTITEKMLQSFIRSIYKGRRLRPRMRVLVCVPSGSTQVERRAIRESVFGAGAKEVFLIEEPMAAAIGAGLPVETPSGSMVVDIGGGTTEVAIISLNGIVYAQSVRIGGDHFDENIMTYVRRNFGTLIGEATAENIKHHLGSAFPSHEVRAMEFSGRNVSEGIPRSFSMSSHEVLEALHESLAGIISAVKTALESCPPELASDIASTGLVLTGGGALLQGIDQLVMEETGLPVRIAEHPLTCVARGGAKVLEMLELKSVEFLAQE